MVDRVVLVDVGMLVHEHTTDLRQVFLQITPIPDNLRRGCSSPPEEESSGWYIQVVVVGRARL
ncbi:hypothetical protein [Mycobacterium sp.]|uniref:hypothetical protein n=1 Tax=Mycobacterium sp. TaxID=1785 RepID=UPI003BABCDC6